MKYIIIGKGRVGYALYAELKKNHQQEVNFFDPRFDSWTRLADESPKIVILCAKPLSLLNTDFIQSLAAVRCVKKIVLISSSGVLENFGGDDVFPLTVYETQKFKEEIFFREQYPSITIIRIPILFSGFNSSNLQRYFSLIKNKKLLEEIKLPGIETIELLDIINSSLPGQTVNSGSYLGIHRMYDFKSPVHNYGRLRLFFDLILLKIGLRFLQRRYSYQARK